MSSDNATLSQLTGELIECCGFVSFRSSKVKLFIVFRRKNAWRLFCIGIFDEI